MGIPAGTNNGPTHIVVSQWEDINFDPVRGGGAAATIPAEVRINDCFYREFDSNNNELVGDGAEVPHNAKLGGKLYPHAHIFLKASETEGTTGVTFTLYWELRTHEATTSGSVEMSATSAQLAANGNKIDIYGTEFDGPATLGAQLAMTLARTAGNAGDVVVTTYGVHYEVDSMGSNGITSK